MSKYVVPMPLREIHALEDLPSMREPMLRAFEKKHAAEFDNIKVGTRVVVDEFGMGIVQRVAVNGVGQTGIVVKFNDGSVKGLFTARQTHISNIQPEEIKL